MSRGFCPTLFLPKEFGNSHFSVRSPPCGCNFSLHESGCVSLVILCCSLASDILHLSGCYSFLPDCFEACNPLFFQIERSPSRSPSPLNPSLFVLLLLLTSWLCDKLLFPDSHGIIFLCLFWGCIKSFQIEFLPLALIRFCWHLWGSWTMVSLCLSGCALYGFPDWLWAIVSSTWHEMIPTLGICTD